MLGLGQLMYQSGIGLGQQPQPSGLGGLLSDMFGCMGYGPQQAQQARGYPGMGFAGQQAMMAQQQAQQSPYFGPYTKSDSGWLSGVKRKVKRVESREVTCMEVATKQITGAVRAVDDAQQAVVDAQERS